MKIYIYILLFVLMLSSQVFCQNEIIPLWTDKVPNYIESGESEIQSNEEILWIEKVQIPDLAVYLPAKQNATGKGVLICPGGGYAGLAYDWEGTDIAKWLNSKGIAGFVLKYRLPDSKSITVPSETPLMDAERAIRLIRYFSDKWNVKKNQIGVMGFSAGGHLASTLGTHYDLKNIDEPDAIDQLSSRPDFMALIYPVITMDDQFTHKGSRINLLGENPEQELINFYSNELHVNSNTPPAFFVHSSDDEAVPVENSILFYEALKKHGVYSEMHIYPTGGHGYSLAIGDGHLQTWPDRFYEWLESLNM